MCILHEQGNDAEAERLRTTALTAALARAKTNEESDSLLTARLDALFAVERERVANAAVLAELLAPLLGERSAVVVPFPSAAVKASTPARARAASIADFIDEMIAQERA